MSPKSEFLNKLLPPFCCTSSSGKHCLEPHSSGPVQMIFAMKNLNSFLIFFLFFLLFKKIFIGVQLLYNTVLVYNVQQSESAICIHTSPLFWISFSFRSPQSTEQSSLCYAVGSHQLSILYIVVYICQSQSPKSSHTLPFPPWYPYICSLCLCLYFCFVNKIVYTNFSRFHIYALIYDICFKREYFWSELFSLAIDETQLDNYTSLPLTSPILA